MTELQLISFEVEPSNRLRRAIFRGVITEEILFAAYEQLLSQPDYDPTLNDLVDMRLVERLDISTHGVRQLVMLFAQPGAQGESNKLAIVAAKSSIFGMARMYELLSADTSEQIQVFRDLRDAEGWLGVKDADQSH